MHPDSRRFRAITESQFAWEREALEYLREGLPDREPYRVWTNFEFIADDGSLNEVDALVLAPAGFFLVEIKSNQGGLSGDAGTWTWRHDGREITRDNPLHLANLKAKRLKSLLTRQRAVRKAKGRLPFLEPKIFLSATNLQVSLDESGRHGVWCRDDLATGDGGAAPLPGVLSSLAGGGTGRPASHVQMGHARALEKALEEAGIRPSQRLRRVGDYSLEELIADGGAWQDWHATHSGLEGIDRRVRIYTVGRASSPEERKSLQRAAEREFRLLQGVLHPGILRVHDYRQHELGPALLFDYSADAQRLDHYLRERGDALSFEGRLHLLRSVAEALAHAHQRRLYHRALAPESILVVDPEAALPETQLFNWQTGVREAGTTTFSGHAVSGTVHVDDLVRETAAVYVAPEVRHDADADGVAADVFSLGALAYLLFARRPPASNPFELQRTLRDSDGLVLAAAVDGAPVALDDLVREATCPEVGRRLATVKDFLAGLDLVEDEVTTPEDDAVDDPDTARRGDRLEGGLEVLRRLGQGSTSLVFLVRGTDGAERVLKLARHPDRNDLLDDEAAVLDQLRHPGVVEIHGKVELYGRTGILMARAGDRTLAEYLRKEPRLELELLERFGDDLLTTVAWLEEQGIPHRDIKPDNLGVRKTGKNDVLHLVLFDFSLSRTPAEKLEVGTRAYLDPFLAERPTPRWDLAAERFAAAATLHEMAAGTLPGWGDGRSAPAAVAGEVKLQPEHFREPVRLSLAGFFRKALARDAADRFDNAQEMLRAWRQALYPASRPTVPPPSDEEDEGDGTPPSPLDLATLDSNTVELGLSQRAFNALDKLDLETVRQLLGASLGQVTRLRGVGAKTRDELVDAVRRLRVRFPDLEPETTDPPEPGDEGATPGDEDGTPTDEGRVSVDRLAAILLTKKEAAGSENRGRALRLFLGLDTPADLAADTAWPSQTEIAEHLRLTRARVSQVIGDARRRWLKTSALKALRDEVPGLLAALGGVATLAELEGAVLTARGSARDEPERSAHAAAATRAAIDAEGGLQQPAFRLHRIGGRLLVALVPSGAAGTDAPLDAPESDRLARWAAALGEAADELAARDPLPPSSAVVDALLEVPAPPGQAPLPAPRLVRLAAAASRTAAVSGRLEIYPQGMEAARALRLAASSVLSLAAPGRDGLTVEAIRDRVRSRYPEAEPLPDPPALHALLAEEPLGLEWRPATATYRPTRLPGVLSGTGSSRLTRTPEARPAPEARHAADLQARLARSLKHGGYLLLVVPPRRLQDAQERLLARFEGRLEALSLEGLLLGALRKTADEKNVDWSLVLKADAAAPESRDGKNLRLLVDIAIPHVEEAIVAHTSRGGSPAVLLTHPGLLARYRRFDLLERLRDRMTRPADDGLQTLWILAPGDEQIELPRIDGQAVPVVTPSEWARIPESWLRLADLVPPAVAPTESSDSPESPHGPEPPYGP